MVEENDVPADANVGGDSPAAEGSPGGGRGVRGLVAFAVALLVVAVVLFVKYRDVLQQDWERWQSMNEYESEPPEQEPPEVQIIPSGDKTFLWGGHDEQHFDITEFRLDKAGLTRGIGRNYLPPSIDPSFIAANEVGNYLRPSSRVMVAKTDGETKIYPIRLVSKYTAVNDVVEGTPICVVYNGVDYLACIYERQFGDKTLTFADSGYAYVDMDSAARSVVLWDMETESLWWPSVGKGISGPCVDIPLQVLDKALWAQMTWEEASKQFPDAKVFYFDGASDDAVASVTRQDPPDMERLESDESGPDAVRWGEKLEFE